jgi:hypothetical protein
MTASKKHLDAVFDNVSHMNDVVRRLERLAHSFHVTGNDKVADRLYNICDEIVTAACRVRDSFSESQSEQLRETQANTGAILSMLLNPVTGEE